MRLRIARSPGVICPNHEQHPSRRLRPIMLGSGRATRSHRAAGDPRADVGGDRSAVPASGAPAGRRHGGLRDDRLLGDGAGEPATRCAWRRWTAPGGPNAVQLAGCEPDAMAEAARIAGGSRRRPDRHQFRLPGEEGGGRPARRLGADARRGGGGAHPRGDGARGRGAGHAEDADGLGPRAPQCARAWRRSPSGRGIAHGDGAWPHAAAILHRPAPTGSSSPG